jgi:hypothetical protein
MSISPGRNTRIGSFSNFSFTSSLHSCISSFISLNPSRIICFVGSTGYFLPYPDFFSRSQNVDLTAVVWILKALLKLPALITPEELRHSCANIRIFQKFVDDRKTFSKHWGGGKNDVTRVRCWVCCERDIIGIEEIWFVLND